MIKVFCDLCKKEMPEQDKRYISFTRKNSEERKPIHRELEVCPICLEKIHGDIDKKTSP